MTTITSTDPHTMQLEFALIRLDKRWHELAEAARQVCREAPAETEAVARLRALVEVNPPDIARKENSPTVGQAG